MTKFNVGDIVRLKKSLKPMQVLLVKERGHGIPGPQLRCIYLSALSYGSYQHDGKLRELTGNDLLGFAQDWRTAEDYVLFTTETEKTEMAKLYEIKDGEQVLFGTMLAQNSQGKIVLEIKGTGEVRAFDLADIKEVLPFTVRIKRAAQPSRPGSDHYIVPENALAVGDFVLFPGTLVLGRVAEVDTKNANAGRTKLYKLSVAPVTPTAGLEPEESDVE